MGIAQALNASFKNVVKRSIRAKAIGAWSQRMSMMFIAGTAVMPFTGLSA